MARKPRNRFAQPFLVGALSSSFLGACISQTSLGEDDGGSAERSSTCPQELPVNGTSCASHQRGLKCQDAWQGCAPAPPYTIACGDDDKWKVIHPPVACNPPPPSPPPITKCPDEIPSAKTSCAGYQEGLICPETTCPPTDHVSCGPNGTWEPLAISCNPPPPITECPKELPNGGTSCAAYQPGLKCEDPARSCSHYPPFTIACGDDGNWEVIHPAVACNPPPPMGGAGGESSQ